MRLAFVPVAVVEDGHITDSRLIGAGPGTSWLNGRTVPVVGIYFVAAGEPQRIDPPTSMAYVLHPQRAIELGEELVRAGKALLRETPGSDS